MTGAPGQSQSLYRKYRPRSFAADELVGQEHIARTLQNAIALDRVAHAYLFCGPRGTGKTSTARLLAKAVNCEHPDPMARPCNACPSCDAINAGAAVDIIEIDAASNRGVDDIRDLREKVKYAPTQLRVKFYIIDEAHQLTRDAFNAFLKTLEEPPPHVKFVLATTEPDKLPDTVASRCQRFDFRRVPLAAMVDHLGRICEREGLSAEDEALRLVAQHATGSLRDALGLLDQLALYESVDGRPRITADAVRQVLGLSRGDRITHIVAALAERDTGAGLRLIAEAAESGEDVHQLNRQLVAYLRSLLHLRAGGRDTGADELAREQASCFTLSELVEAVRAFSSIDAALNRGSYAQLPLELALVDVILALRGEGLSAPQAQTMIREEPRQSRPAAPPPTPQASPARPAAPAPRTEERSERPAREPEGRTRPVAAANGSGVAGAPAPNYAPMPPGDGASIEQLASNWSQIRRDVKIANSRIAALLGSVDPAGIDGERVLLVSAYEFHRNKLNDASARAVIEDVISRHLGGRYQLSCVAPEELAATRSRSAPQGPAPRPTPGPSPSPVVVAPSEPIEFEPTGPSVDDEEILRAAKAIFNATELEPE